MLYIYCPRKSESATALTHAINDLGLKTARVKKKGHIQHADGDVGVINWGGSFTGCASENWLNKAVFHNKFQELQALAAKGIPVPPHRIQPINGGLSVARLFHHHEANDLLAELTVGDYYVKLVPTDREYRVHCFAGKVLRLAKKVPRLQHHHPVFRSHAAGWKMSYALWDDVPNGLRKLAHRAVEALGYDFGAVDIAVKPDGGLVVWEVNSAPGIEGGTIDRYAQAIKEWYEST